MKLKRHCIKSAASTDRYSKGSAAEYQETRLALRRPGIYLELGGDLIEGGQSIEGEVAQIGNQVFRIASNVVVAVLTDYVIDREHIDRLRIYRLHICEHMSQLASELQVKWYTVFESKSECSSRLVRIFTASSFVFYVTNGHELRFADVATFI